MPVGFPTKVNYATGDVLSATNMNDLSGTVNLLDGTQYSGGKNRVLNSAMQVWQRGTTALATATGLGNGFTSDRWQLYRSGFNANASGSRQTTSDTTNLPFIQYCNRIQRTAASTGTQTIFLAQNFESINSIPLAGKTVTFSFYARAGANYSATSNILVASVLSGTGTDENMANVYAGQATVIGQNTTLTTTWQRFTYSGSVASTATQIGVRFEFTPTGTAGANDYFEVTGVQLEASTVASAFSTNGSTYQAELAACQRYFQIYGDLELFGQFFSATSARFVQYLPVSMRIAPATTFPTGAFTNFVDVIGVGSRTPTGFTVNGTKTSTMSFDATGMGATTLYAGAQYRGTNISYSAEL